MFTANRNSCAWADLPACGLGNKLLIWGNAFVFSRQNQLPLVTTGWQNRGGLRTWLRGGGWRRYQREFQSPGWMERYHWRQRVIAGPIIDEPDAIQASIESGIYRFRQMTHWSDYFKNIKPWRDEVIQAVPALLTPTLRKQVDSLLPIEVAVHVRLGDFRKLKPGEDFAKVGQVRTPLDYFVRIVNNVREIVGREMRVTVFSDGKSSELDDLLSLRNVTRAEPAPAIVDIYKMAKSKLLVCAAGSTFSYWSAFLGSQPVIVHRDHFHSTIRPANLSESLFEGAVPDELAGWPLLLRQNVSDTDWRAD